LRQFAFSLRRPCQRAVVLLYERAELFRHFIGSGKHDGVLLIDFTAQRELDALHLLCHVRLQPRQLVHVLIDAIVLQLAKRAQHFLELTRIELGTAQHAAQIADFVLPLPHFAAQLTDVLGRELEIATIPPATPPVFGAHAAGVVADASVEVAEVRTVTNAGGVVAATTVVATLLVLGVLATLTALTLLPLLTLLSLLALLTGLPLLSLLTALALAVLCLLTLLTILALLAVLALLALLAVLTLLAALRLLLPLLSLALLTIATLLPLLSALATLARALLQRLEAACNALGAFERLLALVTRVVLIAVLADRRRSLVELPPHVVDTASDLAFGRAD
jgi:hypothetical protein